MIERIKWYLKKPLSPTEADREKAERQLSAIDELINACQSQQAAEQEEINRLAQSRGLERHTVDLLKFAIIQYYLPGVLEENLIAMLKALPSVE